MRYLRHIEIFRTIGSAATSTTIHRWMNLKTFIEFNQDPFTGLQAYEIQQIHWNTHEQVIILDVALLNMSFTQ